MRAAKEGGEARSLASHYAPGDAEAEESEDRVAAPHMPLEPFAASLAADPREEHQRGEQPMGQPDGNVPDQNPLGCDRRWHGPAYFSLYSSWHALQALPASPTTFLSAARSVRAALGSAFTSLFILSIF